MDNVPFKEEIQRDEVVPQQPTTHAANNMEELLRQLEESQQRFLSQRDEVVPQQPTNHPANKMEKLLGHLEEFRQSLQSIIRKIQEVRQCETKEFRQSLQSMIRKIKEVVQLCQKRIEELRVRVANFQHTQTTYSSTIGALQSEFRDLGEKLDALEKHPL